MKIDTLQCSGGAAPFRDAGYGVVERSGWFGLAVSDDSSSTVRSSAGDWGRREWGMSIRGSRV
jgi:hypothetical protein